MSDQIGVTGNAKQWGIPASTVKWTGPSTTTHTLTIFTEISKTMLADIDPTLDNSGERLGENRRNKRVQLRFSAHPIGAAATNAQAIGADLPYPGDGAGTLIITAASDAEADCSNGSGGASTTDTALIDDASARWTPEGELVVDFTITKWIGKVFIALS